MGLRSLDREHRALLPLAGIYTLRDGQGERRKRLLIAALDTDQQRRAMRTHRRSGLPEIVEIEPVLGCGASVRFQPARILADAARDRLVARLAPCIDLFDEPLEMHVVAARPAIPAEGRH